MPRTHLDELESKSIFVIREAYAHLKNLGMLWSIGKDSTVMLHLAKKAFFGHVPFPLIHVDTDYKITEMIEYRDRLVRDQKLELIVAQNKEALDSKQTFPDGSVDRIRCCQLLKTTPLRDVIEGRGFRKRYDPVTDKFSEYTDPARFDGIIAGIRSDEEGTRSKERYFSVRGRNSQWDIANQPPEFWNYFCSDCPPGCHLRVHPLLDWREIDIWAYIARENIPTVSLYYDQGDGTRYRSLGCYPCTKPVQSEARNATDIIEELARGRFSNIAERSGRAQDSEGGGTLEDLRRDGYM